MALTDTSTRTHIRRFHANLWSRDRGGHRGRSQTNTNARKCASGRLPRPPRTPTTSPSERTCNERANTPLGVPATVPDGAHGRRHKHESERHRRGDWKRRGGRGDGGDDANDDGADAKLDGRGHACASRAQTSVSVCVCADDSTSRDAHMWVGGGGRTFARIVALAVQEGPPSPVPRPVPIHGIGRAVHSRVQSPLWLAAARHLPLSCCRW